MNITMMNYQHLSSIIMVKFLKPGRTIDETTLQNLHLKWRDAYLKKIITMAITTLLLLVSNFYYYMAFQNSLF